ncbi:MAG: Hsp70 family protein [Chloroflexi bacterium]|nr:Hsp70 family protein [Chloroflexota bacterium]
MGFPTLLIVGIVIILAAYGLGQLLRRLEERQDLLSALKGSPAADLLKRLAGPAAPAPSARETDALVRWLLSQAFEQTGVRVADEPLAYNRIVEAAEKTVAQLKSEPAATISLPFLTADERGPRHFEAHVTRALVKELLRD